MEQYSTLDNQQERREAAIRVGAFFEGEGTFIVSTAQIGKWRCLKPSIRLGNCDPEALQKLSVILKSFRVGHRIYMQKTYKPGHASTAVLSMDGLKRVAAFLEHFGDFFFGRKRKNVQLFRTYIPQFLAFGKRDVPERQRKIDEFKCANKELNQLGISRFPNDYTLNVNDEDIVCSVA